MRKKLEKHLDVIANKDDKDYHPGSHKKVIDLIHPSLYPYVKGISPHINGISKYDFEDTENLDRWNRPIGKLEISEISENFILFSLRFKLHNKSKN